MNKHLPNFFVDHNTIRQRLDKIEPSTYAQTRNYLHGAVTYLSPFITHGIIDTRTVADAVLEKYTGRIAEKLLTEIAWREYFHRVWQAHGDNIFTDIRQPQENIESAEIPSALVNSSTGIDAIDDAIANLLVHGYMHNHARMWLAAITCNVSRRHWYQPARWLYYHLLDGDIASNNLSWQWICGSFSHRKYYANQDNLNRYTARSQLGTFLDTDYDQLLSLPVPDTMRQSCVPTYNNLFPVSTADPVRAGDKQVLLHSIWNLDPTWRNKETGRRLLWIEPSMHQEFALSPLRWKFVQHWASQITGLEIFVGEKAELFPEGLEGLEGLSIISREYPAIDHWPLNNDTKRDPRRWCYPPPKETIGSFSKFWKPIRKTSEFFN